MLKTSNQTLETTLTFARFMKYAALLIGFAAFINIPIFTFVFSAPRFAWVKWEMAAVVIISIITAVSAHRGQVALGAVFISVTIAYVTIGHIQPDDFLSRPNSAILILPITIMGFVFGMRVAIALAGAIIASILLAPTFIPGAVWSQYTFANMSLICESIGLLWIIHYLFAQLRLANNQLRESNEREQETRNLMRYFQHELKNYVDEFKGLQDLLQDLFAGKVSSTNAAVTFSHMEQMIEEVDELLQKLLVLGRQGTLPAEQHQPVNLRLLLEQERERFLASSRHPNLEVAVEAPATLTVSASQLYLTLALRTALRNAYDALSQLPAASKREIQLVACSHGDTAMLRVRDNGPGFPSDGKANQIIPGWSAKYGGNGVGMALIRHVAALHGGRMRFGNVPTGLGAWVEIELALQPTPTMVPASSTN